MVSHVRFSGKLWAAGASRSRPSSYTNTFLPPNSHPPLQTFPDQNYHIASTIIVSLSLGNCCGSLHRPLVIKMGFERRANDALKVNGNYVNGALADIAITTHGSDWYWVCSRS